MAATGGSDAVALLWSLEESTWAGKLDHHGEAVTNLIFSADGAYLLTASNQNKARMWNVKSGSLELPPLLHEAAILAMAFSPDNGVIVTASQDHTAKLWRTGSGRQVNASLLHNDAVVSAAFSPDSMMVITGSRDGTVRLWRADTGAPVGKPLQHPEPVERVAFSRDGEWFACATNSAIWFYRRDGERIASRLLEGSWCGSWSIGNETRYVRVVEMLTPRTIRVSVVSAAPDMPGLESHGQQLLREWERRLGLKLDERDRIVPAR
jgi:WD40 repeat protein